MSSVTERVRRRGARLARRVLRRRKARRPAPRPQARGARPTRTPESRGALVDTLERGRALDDALLAEVRVFLAGGSPGRAQAIAESLLRHEQTEALGHLIAGVVAQHRGHVELAWSHLGGLPPSMGARLAPAEYVRAGLAVEESETLRTVETLTEQDPPDIGAEAWYEILAAVFGHGEQGLARAVFAVFDRHVDQESPGWPDGPTYRDWMRPWVAADADSPTAPAPPDGSPVLAVMDYGHPGASRASANIGDHIQSIAGLAHLVRHSGVQLHGDAPLVDLLGTLRDRTRDEFRREDLETDLHVMPVHRDASMYQAIPEGTWVLCLGWYMHAMFTMRHGFPLHRNLRPIFVSFHCNKRELLTRDAVEYLRRYGPVGCRDWTTVHLLTSMDVPAFFSGCVTTTIGAVFPDAPAPSPDAPIGYVDVPNPPAGGVTYKHSSLKVRRRSFVANAKLALDRLDTYRREHSRVVTSRLHCYLPLRSIGVDCDFVPANRADVRFAGLAGIDDAAFEAIRSGITDKLELVLRKILAGESQDDVYAAWRAATAEDVAAALREHRRPVELEPPAAKWDRRLPRVAAAKIVRGRPADRPVHCAVLLRKSGFKGVAALLDSIVEHASRPVHLWLLSPQDTPAGRPGVPGGRDQLDPARGARSARRPARPRPAARAARGGGRAARGAADPRSRNGRCRRARRDGARAARARRADPERDRERQRVRRDQHGRQPARRPAGRRVRAAPRGAEPPRVRFRRLHQGAARARSGCPPPAALHAGGARAGQDLPARRPRDPPLPVRAGPGTDSGPVGGRPDAHGGARSGPAALGRGAQAVG